MDRNALLITLLVIVTAAIGLFFYDRHQNAPDATVWDIVPESTTLVYEPQSGLDAWEYLKNSGWWESLEQIDPWSELDSLVLQLDTLAGREQMNELISDGRLLIGISPVSGSGSDFLLMLRRNSRDATMLNELIGHFLDDDYNLTYRDYYGFRISEVRKRGEGIYFSFASNDEYWFGSFTPVLVEDVIRQISEETEFNFRSVNPEPFFTTRIRGDAGNFYFNYQKLSGLIDTFLDPVGREDTRVVSEFAKDAFFDITLDEQLLILNGFSYVSAEDQFLSRFLGSSPRSSSIEQYIPNNTAFCVHTLHSGEPNVEDRLMDFTSTLTGEYAAVVMEGGSVETADKLYYLGSADVEESITNLRSYAVEIQQNAGDTLYYEQFGSNTIIELRANDFPSRFSTQTFGRYPVYYFTQAGGYVILGTSIESIKNFLLELESEVTWGRSVRKNNFLSSTLQESNFNIYIDINKSWTYFLSALDPEWRRHFERYASLYRKFELLAIQFSLTDNKFYSNMVISHNPAHTELFGRRRMLDPDVVSELDTAIITDPKVVRNHRNNQREIIVQDASNAISLISGAGRVLWTDTLPSPVVSEIQQVDFFNNGFLQYIMATDSALWLYDRTGKIVEGFPWKLPFRADHFNVIDYDNSKRYRFMFSDLLGNVYMYNKEGLQLDGWRPNATEGRLARAPMHIRVRGRDCILILQQKGDFLLFNRRGELQSGFPVRFGPYIRKDFAIKYGADFSSTVLSFINRDGLLTRINLEGEVRDRQQFIKPSRNAIFDIVPEAQGKGFVVVLKELAYFRIMNESGSEILQKDLISTNPFEYQYYDFGSARKLYVVTDPEQEYSYIYNARGELVNNIPIESGFDIGVLYSEVSSQYRIYSAYQDKINIYVFQ